MAVSSTICCRLSETCHYRFWATVLRSEEWESGEGTRSEEIELVTGICHQSIHRGSTVTVRPLQGLVLSPIPRPFVPMAREREAVGVLYPITELRLLQYLWPIVSVEPLFSWSIYDIDFSPSHS